MKLYKTKEFEKRKSYYISFDSFENATAFIEDLSKKCNDSIPEVKRTIYKYEKGGPGEYILVNYFATIGSQHRDSIYVSDVKKGDRWKNIRENLKEVLGMGKPDFNVHEENVDPSKKDLFIGFKNKIASYFLDPKWENMGTELSAQQMAEKANELRDIIGDIFPKKAEKKVSRLKKLKKIEDKIKEFREEFKIFYKNVKQNSELTEMKHLSGNKIVYVLFKKKLLQFLTTEQIEEINATYDFLGQEDVFLVREEDML